MSLFEDTILFDDIDVNDEELEDAILNASALSNDYLGEVFDTRSFGAEVFGYSEDIDYEAM